MSSALPTFTTGDTTHFSEGTSGDAGACPIITLLQYSSLQMSEPFQYYLATPSIITIAASQKQMHQRVGRKRATLAKPASSLLQE